MMSIILDGKKLADKITEKLKAEVDKMDNKPSLAVVLVGNNPASKIYVKNKTQRAKEIGINSEIIEFSEDISQSWLENEIESLAKNDDIDAILVQLPLPNGLAPAKVIEKITPQKDVDGFHPLNIGGLVAGRGFYCLPCTPLGIMELLKEYNISVAGKNVVIVGRSNIVGKPLAAFMTNADATVTLCHSKTQNLKEITKNADILVSAIGKPNYIKKDFVKYGAVVIDVGINRLPDGKITGDVDYKNVIEKTSYITPVPGGVGPMTIAMLMKNTIDLAK